VFLFTCNSVEFRVEFIKISDFAEEFILNKCSEFRILREILYDIQPPVDFDFTLKRLLYPSLECSASNLGFALIKQVYESTEIVFLASHEIFTIEILLLWEDEQSINSCEIEFHEVAEHHDI